MKRMFVQSLIAVIILTAGFQFDAFAGRIWINSEISAPPYQPSIQANKVALAMRSNGTWPVVAYSGPQTGTAVMTPAGWISNNSSNSSDYGITAASSGNKAGFAYGTGEAAILGPGGWSRSYYSTGMGRSPNYRPSMAFDRNGNAAVLHNQSYENGPSGVTLSFFNGYGWTHDLVTTAQSQSYNSMDYFGLKYDSYNQANIVFNDGGRLEFGIKGALTNNQWYVQDIMTPSGINALDFALSGNDVPYVAYSNFNNQLYLATYDAQQNKWSQTMLAEMQPQAAFSIASDSLGGIGLAYVSQSGAMNYLYKNGTSNWDISFNIATANSWSGVSLAFDAMNNPVIAYSSAQNNSLYLAYDPVPEPASVVLLGLGAIVFRSRRTAAKG